MVLFLVGELSPFVVKWRHDPTCQSCTLDCLCQHLAQHKALSQVPKVQKARTATATVTVPWIFSWGSGAVILEASRWAPTQQTNKQTSNQTNKRKEHLGSSQQERAWSGILGTLNKETTTATTGKRKQVQQQTAREEKGEGLIPTQECGEPPRRKDGNRPQHRNAHGSKWKSNKSTCLKTQAEAEATNNIWWKLKMLEEWNYKFTACMGTQDSIYPDLLARAERATTVLQICLQEQRRQLQYSQM